MLNYTILSRKNTTDLEVVVNEFISLGYIPIGSIFYDGKKFYQTMIKKEE